MMRSTEKYAGIADWEMRSRLALDWLHRSFAATGGRGFSHSYHPLFGWAKAYPETSGYLLPTLLDYAAVFHDPSLVELAEKCCEWLISIQLPGGAFPGLLAGSKTPSVFNTSQILFGLSAMGKQAEAALESAVNWLLDQREPAGYWIKHAFVKGYSPAYYSRLIWAMLEANKKLQVADCETFMGQSLSWYTHQYLLDSNPSRWSFSSNETAYTHTIAYTLEGFWEAGQLLDQTRIQELVIQNADTLLKEREKAGGRTAGRYGAGWKGDFHFICVTGNAQLSVLYHKLYLGTGFEKYRTASLELLSEILPAQKMAGRPAIKGALPGSMPFWGGYLPFRYPNWATKFFLDALLVHRPVVT